MLVQLHIENYALVERAVVEFGPGFNVLTGETGAGKSLIIGALGLALGQRAHTDMLRTEDKPTLVEARFDLTASPHLPELVNALGIPVAEATLLLKRVLTKSGSRCSINAQLATVAMLQHAGQYLVDMLGQQQQHTLLQREQQLALLDSFGKLTAERAALQRASQHYRTLEQDSRRVRQAEQQRQQRLELLQLQGQEIAQAQLQYHDTLRREQQAWERHAERLTALTAELGRARQALKSLAITLSDKRRQAAERLQQAVQHELQELHMVNTVFQVAHTLRYHPQGELRVGTERVTLTADGIDAVEYLFSPNPGQPPKPIARFQPPL